MTHWERLWHVGVWVERGEDMRKFLFICNKFGTYTDVQFGDIVAKLADGVVGGMVWEFVKV